MMQQIEPFNKMSFVVSRITLRCCSNTSLVIAWNNLNGSLHSDMVGVVEVKLYLALNIYQESLKVFEF
jgi:hypothetical protein